MRSSPPSSPRSIGEGRSAEEEEDVATIGPSSSSSSLSAAATIKTDFVVVVDRCAPFPVGDDDDDDDDTAATSCSVATEMRPGGDRGSGGADPPPPWCGALSGCRALLGCGGGGGGGGGRAPSTIYDGAVVVAVGEGDVDAPSSPSLLSLSPSLSPVSPTMSSAAVVADLDKGGSMRELFVRKNSKDENENLSTDAPACNLKSDEVANGKEEEPADFRNNSKDTQTTEVSKYESNTVEETSLTVPPALNFDVESSKIEVKSEAFPPACELKDGIDDERRHDYDAQDHFLESNFEGAANVAVTYELEQEGESISPPSSSAADLGREGDASFFAAVAKRHRRIGSTTKLQKMAVDTYLRPFARKSATTGNHGVGGSAGNASSRASAAAAKSKAVSTPKTSNRNRGTKKFLSRQRFGMNSKCGHLVSSKDGSNTYEENSSTSPTSFNLASDVNEVGAKSTAIPDVIGVFNMPAELSERPPHSIINDDTKEKAITKVKQGLGKKEGEMPETSIRMTAIASDRVYGEGETLANGTEPNEAYNSSASEELNVHQLSDRLLKDDQEARMRGLSMRGGFPQVDSLLTLKVKSSYDGNFPNEENMCAKKKKGKVCKVSKVTVPTAYDEENLKCVSPVEKVTSGKEEGPADQDAPKPSKAGVATSELEGDAKRKVSPTHYFRTSQNQTQDDANTRLNESSHANDANEMTMLQSSEWYLKDDEDTKIRGLAMRDEFLQVDCSGDDFELILIEKATNGSNFPSKNNGPDQAGEDESLGSEDTHHAGPNKDQAYEDRYLVSDDTASLTNNDKRIKGRRNVGWLSKFVLYDFGSLFLKPKRVSQGTHESRSNEEFDDDDASFNGDDASRDDDGSCVDCMDESRDDVSESICTYESSSFGDGTFSGSEWTQLRPVNPRNIMLVQ